jgi:cytokinesis protein
MDSLLEKLRAAAPQARDQRDRRRRARLKERHQVRVASGQQIPNMQGIGAEGEGESTIVSNDNGDHLAPQDAGANGQESPQVSEGEDIADRAANLLQGLRSNTDTDEERARRRRESAEDERRARRLRMRSRNTANGSKDSADGSLPSVIESVVPEQETAGTESTTTTTPAIIVSESTEDQPQDEQQEQHDLPEEGSSPDRPVEISD